MVYLYLPSCRALSFSASLCCFLQGIWRSLTLPSKSIVFAIYSPPILLYLPSSSPSPASPLFIFASFFLCFSLPRFHLCLFSLISCLILFVIFSCSPPLFLSYLITSLPKLLYSFLILFPSCFLSHCRFLFPRLPCNSLFPPIV